MLGLAVGNRRHENLGRRSRLERHFLQAARGRCHWSCGLPPGRCNRARSGGAARRGRSPSRPRSSHSPAPASARGPWLRRQVRARRGGSLRSGSRARRRTGRGGWHRRGGRCSSPPRPADRSGAPVPAARRESRRSSPDPPAGRCRARGGKRCAGVWPRRCG